MQSGQGSLHLGAFWIVGQGLEWGGEPIRMVLHALASVPLILLFRRSGLKEVPALA